MKKCTILHINDGNPKEVHNGNRLYVEEYVVSEDVLNPYLAAGFEVKHIVPWVRPNINEEGSFPFFNDGFIVYLEKEE